MINEDTNINKYEVKIYESKITLKDTFKVPSLFYFNGQSIISDIKDQIFEKFGNKFAWKLKVKSYNKINKLIVKF